MAALPVYEKGKFYAIAVKSGFEIYKNDGVAAVRVASIGNGPAPSLGMARVITEIDRRIAEGK